ncbi:MAG: bifunctional nuclease family protein [Candidatus Rokuibacteriota bacterium]
MRIGRAGTLGVLLIVGLVTVGAKGAPEVATPGAGAQEAEVAGVVVDPTSRQPMVVLQGKRDKRSLVMAIGPFEATGIALPLQGVTPSRPLTHDLIMTLLGDLKATLQRIVITDLRDDVYYALLFLDVNGTMRLVDSRPSDAIALALRAKVPILVEDRVFYKAERPAPQGPSRHF